ncbi:hypothetical protein FPOA_06417 [Fusarium poae]|uniref:2EXR domain-containing protein n=1 Tax=Fusarium poae TaxID=36050 RepID=A0A1B8AZG3_FUSPO|nr:hypothetical protein FPOA_06417 [Fusarium poae]
MFLKPPRHAGPQCGLPPVVIRHPDYPEHQNTLLRFPRLDSAVKQDQHHYGVHHGTVLTACQIITGNPSTAYLSHDKHGNLRVTIDYDGVLLSTEYFLQVPTGIDDTNPYAVICNFEDWKFPHNNIPAEWTNLESAPLTAVSASRICSLSGSSVSTEPAYLVPQNQSDWFHQNRMGDYIANRGQDSGPGNASNTCHLQSDLLRDLNDQAFALVPKKSPEGGYRLVAHYLSTSDYLSYPSNIFHNQEVYQLERYMVEFLYACFAYATFGLLGNFMEYERRVAVLEPGKDASGMDTWVTSVCRMNPQQLADRRNHLETRSLRKRNLPGSGMFTEHLHGTRSDRESLARLGRPIISLQSRRSLRAPGDRSLQPWSNHSREQARSLTFNDLPQEVRHLIWEATWREPRVIGIETPDCDFESQNFPANYGKLKIVGSMTSWLGRDRPEPVDEDGEVITGRVPKEYQYPVALSICVESRTHALRHFTLIRHHKRIEYSFYFNPTLDVFTPSGRSISTDDIIPYMSRVYGRQLTSIKKMITPEDFFWYLRTGVGVICSLSGLEVIQILPEDPSTTITELIKKIQKWNPRFEKDNRWFSRIQLVDYSGRVLGEIEMEPHN